MLILYTSVNAESDLEISNSFLIFQDNNVLLKYVNTFNRKIYAFEVISVSTDSTLSVDSMSCDHLLNNGDNPSLQHDFELPGSSRVELPYHSDGQVSNQSFDSVNVNSPSSRDTPDYSFSDAESTELNYQEQEPSTSDFNAADDHCAGECQSTSDRSSPRRPLMCDDYSRNHLSWKLSHETGEADRIQTMPSSSFPVHGDEHVDSCAPEFWLDENGVDGKEPVGEDDRGSEDETVVSEACSSQTVLCESSSPVHLSHRPSLVNSSPARTEEDEDIDSEPGTMTSVCTTVTTSAPATSMVTIHGGGSHRKVCNSGGSNSHGSSGSRNPSRSCPSPDGESHASEPETTLLGVAARLDERNAGYFHHSHSDTDYGFYQEGVWFFFWFSFF